MQQMIFPSDKGRKVHVDVITDLVCFAFFFVFKPFLKTRPVLYPVPHSPQIWKEKAKKRYNSKKGETEQPDKESTIILDERMFSFLTLKRFSYKNKINIYLLPSPIQ